MPIGSGGARARSGPVPKDTSIGEWIPIPIEGRQGPTPDWPLSEASARELSFWNDLWQMPQAVMWEKQVQHVEVALYTRRLVEAEAPNSAIGLGTLVRQMADSLGLTTPGLHRNRWKIVNDLIEVEEVKPELPSARERFKLVSGEKSE